MRPTIILNFELSIIAEIFSSLKKGIYLYFFAIKHAQSFKIEIIMKFTPGLSFRMSVSKRSETLPFSNYQKLHTIEFFFHFLLKVYILKYIKEKNKWCLFKNITLILILKFISVIRGWKSLTAVYIVYKHMIKLEVIHIKTSFDQNSIITYSPLT